jgi:AcrR family transcriptional regulator
LQLDRRSNINRSSNIFSLRDDVARTQEQRKADTRGRLLAAASDLFGRRGFHAVSTEAVADAADRTTGAVYAHFGGKEGLLLALADAGETMAAVEVGAALDAADDLEGRLAALWTAFVTSTDEGAPAWMLLEHELWLYAARNPEAVDGVARRYEDARLAMAGAFKQWADEAGTTMTAAPRRTAVLVLAVLLGLEMQRRVDPDAVPDDLAIEAVRVLFGLEPRAVRPRPIRRTTRAHG